MWWREIKQLKEDLEKAAEDKMQFESDIQSLHDQISGLKAQHVKDSGLK